jgi:hypothetical protein
MTIKSDVMQQVVMGSIAEGSKPAKVASASDVVLNQKQLATIGESVKATMKADDLEFNASELRDDIATSLSKVLGTNPSYAFWNLVSDTFVKVYMANNQISNEESAKNAWYRNAKRIEKLFGLVKPKAPTADASRMSEKRKAEQAELQAKPDSVLREEYLAYKADDNLAKATSVKREIERREKQNSAGLIEQRKAKQALLSKAVKKIANDDLLDQMWALVPQSVKLEIAQDK